MKRFQAVLGAMALIAVAILARQLLSDDSSNSSGDATGGANGPVVACTPDLDSVCETLAADGAIAGDPPTLDLEAAGDPPEEIEGWITWDPAPAIANFDSSTAGPWGDPVVLGSARQAVLMDANARGSFDPGCPIEEWECHVPAAIPNFDRLSVGVGQPTTAEGLARLTPYTFAEGIDYDSDQVFYDGLAELVESALEQDDAPTMSTRLVTVAGSVDVVTGPEAVLNDSAASAQGQAKGAEVTVPRWSGGAEDPMLTIVLAPREGIELPDSEAWCESAGPALELAGVTPCQGSLAHPDLAGLLWQVRNRLG